MEQTYNPRRIFNITLSIILITISAGFITAVKTSGGLFSHSSLAIRNVNFDNISFADSFLKACRTHFWYTICVLVFSGRFPGTAIPGIYLIYRCFSVGVCVGLASFGCVFSKAAGICFSVFTSNFLVFPLYVIMFFLSLKHSKGQHNQSANEYFTFAAKTIVVFAIICAAECIQTFIGTLVLGLMH